jgi:hypothetical protein
MTDTEHCSQHTDSCSRAYADGSRTLLLTYGFLFAGQMLTTFCRCLRSTGTWATFIFRWSGAAAGPAALHSSGHNFFKSNSNMYVVSLVLARLVCGLNKPLQTRTTFLTFFIWSEKFVGPHVSALFSFLL